MQVFVFNYFLFLLNFGHLTCLFQLFDTTHSLRGASVKWLLSILFVFFIHTCFAHIQHLLEYLACIYPCVHALHHSLLLVSLPALWLFFPPFVSVSRVACTRYFPLCFVLCATQ